MIRRLLCWLADVFADSDWLQKMQDAEADANRSVAHQERQQNVIEREILRGYPKHGTEDGR